MIKHRIRDTFYKIKWAFQRAKRGYSDCDVWGFCDWFLEVVPDMLDKLAEEHHGTPISYLDDRFADPDDVGRALTSEEWKEILTKMAKDFRNASELETEFTNEYEDEYLEQFAKAYSEKPADFRIESLKVLAQSPLGQNYSKEEKAICKRRGESLVNAMDAFKKYFWDLWD